MIYTFSEVLEIHNGKNQRNVENKNGNYPIYGSGGIIGFADKYLCDEPAVIIGRKGSINNPLFVDKPFWNVDTAFALVPNSSLLDVRYLYYFCLSYNFNVLSTTVTIPSLTKFNLLKVKIEVPSLEEQKQIVHKLDKIEMIIGLKERQLKDLEGFIRSRFLEMFGDMIHVPSDFREITLEEVCRKNGDVRCGPFGTQLSKSDYLDTGVPVWGIPEINSNFQIWTSDFISQDKASLLFLYSIIPGDIVMSRKGNVGKCEIYPLNYPVGIMHSDVLRIRVDKDLVNPTFLKYQFHFSEKIKHQIEIVSHGAIMAGINVTKLKNIKVLLPAIDRQNQFSEFTHQVDKSKYGGTIFLRLLEDIRICCNI
nr:restriction endonuclease subunit S [uncultured Dialister sp.]